MSVELKREYMRTYRVTHKEQIGARSAAWRAANADKVRGYKRKERDSLSAEKREQVLARITEWQKTHPESRAEIQRRYRARKPDRYYARQKVQIEVSAGRLPKANTHACAVCRIEQAAQYHHHNGYSPEHALDVIAVCTRCHGEISKQEARNGR